MGAEGEHIPMNLSRVEPIPISIDPDLADLLPGYLERRAKDVREMETLVHTGRFGELRQQAHRLAGSAGSYGLPEATEAARHLERAATAGDAPGARDAIAELQRLFSEAVMRPVKCAGVEAVA
jgi:HPt (histidine-containing phosphotransfer) domain-containing protein